MPVDSFMSPNGSHKHKIYRPTDEQERTREKYKFKF